MSKRFGSNSARTSYKTILAIVIASLFAVFLLQNAAVVNIQFLFWKLTVSRVLLLFGALVAGFVIGILLGWEIFRRRAREAK